MVKFGAHEQLQPNRNPIISIGAWTGASRTIGTSADNEASQKDFGWTVGATRILARMDKLTKGGFNSIAELARPNENPQHYREGRSNSLNCNLA